MSHDPTQVMNRQELRSMLRSPVVASTAELQGELARRLARLVHLALFDTLPRWTLGPEPVMPVPDLRMAPGMQGALMIRGRSSPISLRLALRRPAPAQDGRLQELVVLQHGAVELPLLSAGQAELMPILPAHATIPPQDASSVLTVGPTGHLRLLISDLGQQPLPFLAAEPEEAVVLTIELPQNKATLLRLEEGEVWPHDAVAVLREGHSLPVRLTLAQAGARIHPLGPPRPRVAWRRSARFEAHLADGQGRCRLRSTGTLLEDGIPCGTASFAHGNDALWLQLDKE